MHFYNISLNGCILEYFERNSERSQGTTSHSTQVSIWISHLISGGTIVTDLFLEGFKMGVMQRWKVIRVIYMGVMQRWKVIRVIYMGVMQRWKVIGVIYNNKNMGSTCTHGDSLFILSFSLQYLCMVKTSKYTYNNFVNRCPQVNG